MQTVVRGKNRKKIRIHQQSYNKACKQKKQKRKKKVKMSTENKE